MSQVRHRYTHICIMEREGSMARMARTQPSGVDFMLARVEFQGLRPCAVARRRHLEVR